MRSNRYGKVVALCLLLFLFAHMPLQGQTALKIIRENPKFSASNYCIYPDSGLNNQTPPPDGKKPFYISHYGRHGSRYLSNYKGYEIPYEMLSHADSLGKLTPVGQRVLHEMKDIIADSEGRWGDLTGIGKKQQRDIAARMVDNFPEVFKGNAFVNARSTIVTRCMLSMGSALQAMVAKNPQLQIDMNSSYSDMWYLNYQDKLLRDSMMNSRAKKAYDEFREKRSRNPRLMSLLFNDSAYVRESVNEVDMNYYLLKTALMQQNTRMSLRENYLLTLFESEDIHRFWQCENAWWYITYGPSQINGGLQPLTQRYLLRKIITDADSILAMDTHGASLRFGHETVVLPLVCLMGLNGYDYQTSNLEILEEDGWWSCLVFPMASNVQIIFYRKDFKDKDVIFKVLLNEKEAHLPLPNDMAPFYRWRDFRTYYLQKLEKGESALARERQRIHSHLLDHSQQTIGTGW